MKRATGFFHPSHPIEPQTLQRELYWLAAAVAASEGLHRFADENRDDDELDTLRVRHEVTEASRLLISIAVIIRNLQDSPIPRPSGPNRALRKSLQTPIVVGTLNSNGKESALNLRECCNKIIHALFVSFPVATANDRKLSHITSQVILRGELKGKAWEANVDIMQFIRAAYRVSW